MYMNFRQNFSQKKNLLSPFQKKTLAETVNCIPKGLRKGNPFHGPFAQLSYIYIYIFVCGGKQVCRLTNFVGKMS